MKKSRYRIKIASPTHSGYTVGTLPRFFYTITDGLDGPVLKQGSSCTWKGRIGAWYAAEKTIKRLMLKEGKEGMASKTNERIHFRLIHMECCGQMLCWANPRFPSHCPECGRLIYPQVKGWVTLSDPNAHLRFTTKGTLI